MMTSAVMTGAHNPDVELVNASRTGDRNAFGEIVSRYQSLVCSVAYSATGSLTLSEDVAQETFLAAWKQLHDLREPEKLKAWLCGIARNVTRNTLRRLGREPIQTAEVIEAAQELPSPEQPPIDQTINREEEAILWRSLERIPEIYREPLVLFYRQGQSIEQTAALLELTEDAVKQRLSRGRKLLADEVTAFVEGALKGSAPGRAFTIGVLAALPAFTATATAATVGTAVAKGTTAAKATGSVGMASVILGPLLGLFGNYIGYRMSMDNAQSATERAFVKLCYQRLILCVVGISLLYVPLLSLRKPLQQFSPTLFWGAVIGLACLQVISCLSLILWAMRRERTVADELERNKHSSILVKPAWEYRTSLSFLGYPLAHIRLGGNLVERSKPVRAWVAIGDTAFGGLFAFGGVAIAPISIGGCAIGLLAFGGFAMGLFAIGGMSVGAWVLGGLGMGWSSFGGLSIAWKAALGGCALAHDYALGTIAEASQANNSVASQFIKGNWFFQAAQTVMKYIFWMHLLWIVPLLAWWRTTKRANAKTSSSVR